MTDTTASLREKRSGPVRQVDCRKSITISVRNTDTTPCTGERKPCQEPESCKTIEATSSHQSPPIGQPANPGGSQLYCRRSLAGPVQPELRPGCEDPGGAHEEEHRHRGHQRQHQHRRRQCRGQALPQDDARPRRLQNPLVSLLSNFTPSTTGGSRYSAYLCLIRASTAASIPKSGQSHGHSHLKNPRRHC